MSTRSSAPVLVVEGNPDGHRLYYVRVLAEAHHLRPVVWVTTPATLNSIQARTHLGDAIDDGRLGVELVNQCTPSRELVRHLAGRDVVLPDGDKWLPALTTLPSKEQPGELTLVLMRPPSAMLRDRDTRRRRTSAVAKYLLSRSLHVVRGAHRETRVVGLADPFGYTSASRWLVTAADPVLPRSIPTRREARSRLGVPESRSVVGLLGSVDMRKNPELLATALSTLPDHVHLLAVGRLSEAAQSVLARSSLPRDRMTIVDRYVDERELATAAAACDLVSLLHDNDQSSSGILALAAQAGRGVLVPGGGLLEIVAATGRFGIATSLDVPSVARQTTVALERMVDLGVEARKASTRLGVGSFLSAVMGTTRQVRYAGGTRR